MKSFYKKFFWYLGFFLLALFIIFFVGTSTDPQTNITHTTIWTGAIHDFKLGMDIAGGVRLTYKIDFGEYEQAYTNPTELSKVKKETLEIAKEKIHRRISELGVSDANVYSRHFDNNDYLTVEIGGVHNLEEAKAIIGKTVTLTFKVPVSEVTPEVIAERKQQAQQLLTDIQANPDAFVDLSKNSPISEVTYQRFTATPLNQLPLWYQTHTQLLASVQTGTIINTLGDGIYTTDPKTQTNISGFFITKVINKQDYVYTGAITTNIVSSYALQHHIPTTETYTFTPATTGQGFSTQNDMLLFNGGEVFTGEEAYLLSLYKLSPTTGQQQDELQHQVESAIQSGENVTSLTGIQVIYENTWKANSELKNIALMPGTVTLGISSFDQLDGKYIAYIQKIKKAQTPLYFTLQLQTNQDAHTFDQQMRTVTLWTLDTTFIQRTPMRQPAKTTDNQLLNAESFKFATPTLSKATGEPIVYITFDEEGVKRFCDITKQYKGQQLAIFINDVLKTAPTIQAEICTPPTVITGGPFTVEETKKLARELNEGAFPIKMSLESEEKVAPALGGNALQGAIIGAGVGLLAIALFLFFYYDIKKTLIAMIVLIFYLVYLVAFLKLPFIGYAFSLSGIAAIILALGMAVDANVLIFERLIEELRKGTKTSQAIDVAVAKSWSPIKDGNLSTGLIALLLFFVGISIFKGFGGMLLITIALVLIINVPFTKILLHIFLHDKNKSVKK